MEGSRNGYRKSLLNFDGESRLVGSTPTPSAIKCMKKNSFIVVISLIVTLVSGFFIYRDWLIKLLSDYQKSSNVAVVAPIIKDVEEDEKTDTYEVQVKYPEFQGSDSFSTPNDFIKKEFQKNIADFTKDTEENFIAEVGASSYFQVDYEVVMFTGEVASIRFKTDYYVAGMAHPNSYYESFNYDLKNNKQILLADLFSPGSDYLSVLSNLSRESLKIQMDPGYFSEDFVNPGTEPKEENFPVFNFTKDKLIITFNPYQVGPGAVGAQFIEIPFNELVDALGRGEVIK